MSSQSFRNADNLEGIVSVLQFGAVGNGVADDTAAFQAAAATGYTVVVPKPLSKYKFTSPFAITSALYADPKTTWENLTDSGKLSYGSPFYPDTNGASITRLKDRLFVGDGADFTGNFNGTQAGFVPNDTVGASWASRDSVVFGATDKGMMGVTGFASNKNRIRDYSLATIGVAGFAISEQTGPGAGATAVWAMYADVQQNATVIPGSFAHGLEIAAKNNAFDVSSGPYTNPGGVIGIWLAGGGDPAYGGAGNPCNSGIEFVKNGNTWNRGIVFKKDSLTGCDGVNGVATAIAMAKGHQIEWWANGTTNKVAYIRSDIDSEAAFQRIAFANGGMSLGTETFDFLKLLRVTNAANGLTVYPNTTGAPVILAPSESNGYIKIQANGTGEVETGSNFVPATDNSVSVGRSGKRFTSIWAANGTIQTSDEREKTEILNSELGLSFINSLRPVSYRFKVGENVIVEKDEIGNPVRVEQKAGSRTHFGLLAQEVKAALPEGVDFGGWILTDKNDPDSQQGLRYEQFIAPLIKAVQELSAQVSSLKSA